MSPLVAVYVITGIIAFTLAVVVAYVSRLSYQAKIEEERRRGRAVAAGMPIQAQIDDSVKKSLWQEINQAAGPGANAQKISERVSQIFSKELENKMGQVAAEVSKKYETVIQEKTQNEEVAWKKYNKVLGEKKETDAVIRSIAQGLVVVDANGKVVMMNPAAEKLLDVDKKKKIGKSLQDDLKSEQLISLVKETQGKEGKDIELISAADETKKILRSSSAVIENENGQAIGMVSVLSDITKQRELDEMKANLVSNVSHELRTPLVAIEKSITLILGKTTGPLTGPQEQFLTIAQRNLKRLSLLINDLLDLSKIEAGKMKIQPQPSSIDAIVQEAIEGLNSWAQSKSIQLVKKIDPGIPEINVDPNRIIQVLNNLVGNAIKFTPKEGAVTIEAHLNSNEVQVSVQDTGIGIPQEQLPHIFDRFYQVGERSFTDISGTGLGLSISKDFVEMHRGKIWVESEKGQGAKFIFTLPLN